ncbi:MAG: formylmethanofuran dehydrogenase subunit E family protein [Spirochaetes bacterium]|nr:formylmethanofuran dehydrogenase subunit E family protein [Spirochaetota bacterium]
MNAIRKYTIDQYINALTEFHGNFAPGLLIGGFMVGAAIPRMAQYEFFDAICESSSCLPDAIQMLTPCTIGNGWLKIVNTGRFAIILYDKKSGNGVRVSMDVSRLGQYPEIKNWFLRLTAKKDQDTEKLVREIKAAGDTIFTIQDIIVSTSLRGRQIEGRVRVCESCGEAFPESDGSLCRACQGMDIYSETSCSRCIV